MTQTLITDQHSDTASYKILRRLGKGGMAEVFLARQEGLAGFRRLTVIKKLLPQFSEVSEVAEMLLDEARIAAQLTHPNIVQIYELGKENNSYFIAMEYVDGCDLATLARIERHRESRVPLRLVLRVVSEAAMGLDYAHRQSGLDGRPLNIVHRDVSPHNLMCSREGAVKVADFGIAKAVGKALVTQVGVIKGKVQYMSPEQYTSGDVDNRSDIFSLGVVLYQLTTGKLPRVAKDGNINMRRVIEGKIPLPSEIRPDYPEELEAIVMRALAHNREERYSDAASLREDLLDFARENDLLAFPKELGEYVNAMVPPTPLVLREQSMISTGPTADQFPDQDSSRSTGTLPSGDASPGLVADRDLEVSDASDEPEVSDASDEPEESDTDPPSGTEVASPVGARRRGFSHVAASRDTQSPVVGAPAAPVASGVVGTDDERRTSMPRDSSGREASAPPTRSRPPTAPTDPVMVRRSSPMVWITVVSLLVAVGCAAAVTYLLAIRPLQAPAVAPSPTDAARPGAGVINVLSQPSQAVVAIDGARRCPSTPCQIAGLPINRELLLTVRAPGYNLWMQRLVLSHADPKLLLRADLTPLSSTSVEPPPQRDETPSPPGIKRRPTGGKKQPGATKRSPSSKSEGQVVAIPINSDQSLLAIDVRPWAEVWVDQKKMGHTPIQLALVPGKHAVELKNPELRFNKTYRIRAETGKKIKISVAIQPPADQGADAAPRPPGR